MKRCSAVGLFVTICLWFVVGRSYAWTSHPVSQIVSADQFICVGDTAYFDGKTYTSPTSHGSYDPDNLEPFGDGHGIERADWDYGDGEWGTDVGLITSHPYSSASKYHVWLWVLDDNGDWCDTPDDCWVYVAAVEKIVQLGTDDEGPIEVCADENTVVYLAAVCPAEGVPFPEDCPTWTLEEEPD